MRPCYVFLDYLSNVFLVVYEEGKMYTYICMFAQEALLWHLQSVGASKRGGRELIATEYDLPTTLVEASMPEAPKCHLRPKQHGLRP